MGVFYSRPLSKKEWNKKTRKTSTVDGFPTLERWVRLILRWMGFKDAPRRVKRGKGR